MKDRAPRWPLVVASLLALAALSWVLQLVGVIDPGPEPISRQSCAQLATTYDDLSATLASRTATLDERRRATRDAAAVNARVDELGGCPDQPSLR